MGMGVIENENTCIINHSGPNTIFKKFGLFLIIERQKKKNHDLNILLHYKYLLCFRFNVNYLCHSVLLFQ